jgi:hypothetical protein
MRCVLALIAIGMFGLLTGCSSGAPHVTVFVTPSTSSVFVGGSQNFSASVFGTSNTAVTWSVAEANGGTVSSTGNYTAPATAGTYHVVATSVANTADSASAPITVTVPQPVFTSTPPTAATQDQPYSYTLAATDPAGTNVSFALTTAPVGATLNGGTLSWTPSAQQARQDNAFAVTATSAAGGTSTQSWAVAPAGTINGLAIFNHWSADGTVGTTASDETNNSWAALVPQADGSLLALPGTGYVDGTWVIPDVPAGYFWMQFYSGDVLWTNASVFDFGAEYMGHVQLPLAWTYWGCNLTGLDPWDPTNDSLVVFSSNAQAFEGGFTVEAGTGSTVCDQAPDMESVSVMSGVDETQDDITTFAQYENSSALTFFNHALVLGPALNQSMDIEAPTPPPTGDPFQPASISGALTTALSQSQDFTISFSAWESTFNAGGPVNAIPELFEISLNSMQQAAGLALTNPMLWGDSANVAFVAADSNAAWPQDANGNNVWPQDGDFGTLTFNNPFTTGMIATFNTNYIVDSYAYYSIPFPNSTVPVDMEVENYLETPTLPTGFAPGLQPLGNPLVNGTSLFTATTVPTVSPTLTWTAPASSAPVVYNISICQPVLSGTTASCNGIYTFSLYSQTSFTVPAGILTPGDSYIFAIQAESRTGYDPLHPQRFSLPWAQVWTVSAAITVSSSAAAGVVHGDRSLLVAKHGQAKLPGLRSPVSGSSITVKNKQFVSSHPLHGMQTKEQQPAIPYLQPAVKK